MKKMLFAALMSLGVFCILFNPAFAHSTPTPAPVTEIKKSETDDFVTPTMENISKMYWAIGKFTMEDDVAIDNYLFINECDIYQKYFIDDFEWPNIREFAKQSISKEMISFPRNFSLVSPIGLGEYDHVNKQFMLHEDSKRHGVKRIEYMTNIVDVCGSRSNIPGYPRFMVINLNRPLDVTAFPIDPTLAQLYLNETRKSLDGIGSNSVLSVYKRIAYLRLKIEITGYVETTKNFQNFEQAVVSARLVGWEIYADPELKKLLYSHTIPSVHRRKVPFELGSGPLLGTPADKKKSATDSVADPPGQQ